MISNRAVINCVSVLPEQPLNEPTGSIRSKFIINVLSICHLRLLEPRGDYDVNIITEVISLRSYSAYHRYDHEWGHKCPVWRSKWVVSSRNDRLLVKFGHKIYVGVTHTGCLVDCIDITIVFDKSSDDWDTIWINSPMKRCTTSFPSCQTRVFIQKSNRYFNMSFNIWLVLPLEIRLRKLHGHIPDWHASISAVFPEGLITSKSGSNSNRTSRHSTAL